MLGWVGLCFFVILCPVAPKASTGSGSGLRCLRRTNSNQYCVGRVFDLCVYFMTGAPEGSTKSISGDAWNRTCDPGLQGIALMHYTTAASIFFAFFPW